MTRLERFDAIVAELRPRGTDMQAEIADTREHLYRFLLVEENSHPANDPSHWFTTHNSGDAAGDYWVDQEYREDWEILFLVDLDTGERFQPQIAVKWKRAGEDRCP